jgi:hypothetical protein
LREVLAVRSRPLFPERVSQIDRLVIPQPWHPLRSCPCRDREDSRDVWSVMSSERVLLWDRVRVGWTEGDRELDRRVVDSCTDKVEERREFRRRQLRETCGDNHSERDR